jgi:hypothetical protein
MARNWISIIHAPGTTPPWGIPQALVTDFVSTFNDAQAALLKAQSETERTVVVTAQCNAAFKALEDAMRFMKSHYFLVPPLTESDIVSLGLRLKDPPTPSPKPEAQPEADLSVPGIHLVELRKIRPVAGGGSSRQTYPT